MGLFIMNEKKNDAEQTAPGEDETQSSKAQGVQTPEENDGDEAVKRVVAEMFEEHQARLLRMIEIRLPQQLRARVDSNDILQESFMEAYRQLRDKVSKPKGAPLVWLRLIVNQQIVANYRKYCMTQKRNVAREFSISAKRPNADITATSNFLVGQLTSPSLAARRHELAFKVKGCLELLDERSREVLLLRHFEQLTNHETAEELGVTPSAASAMYMRALKKFRVILERDNLDELLE